MKAAFFCILAMAFLGSPLRAQEKMREVRYQLSYDLLAEGSLLSESGERKPAAEVRKLLIEDGMVFQEGAGASFDGESLILSVTNDEDQLARIEKLLTLRSLSGQRFLHMISEWIEVEAADFSGWVTRNAMGTDSTAFRDEVQRWLEEGRAELIDLSVVNGRSGQRAKTVSGEEFLYPSEFDPPEMAKKLKLADGAQAPITGISPTAFEIRILGKEFECDPVLSRDGDEVELNLSIRSVELEGFTDWPGEETKEKFKATTPVFYKMGSSVVTTVRNARYAFLGTSKPRVAKNPKRENPLILRFFRVDVGSTKSWKRLD